MCPLCLEPIKAIESKLNDTYYLESKNDNNGTLDAVNSTEEEVGEEEEEEETDSDVSYSDLDEYDDYPDDIENSYNDYWWWLVTSSVFEFMY